ncbi:hypothetical protein [Nitrososphaera viennensis]|uniref:Uncharacterized protein n=1 Tax=Nitrososphaera viennensis EN76 TaxID=926571 RepID=A0A060HPT0_9ARCH|nr:hypothetical protein [Nitrososphaera viennensis]AIC15561.1 hypothetical protein NVIE_013260 [Nitrososphaera viennensis EN76]
MGTQSHSITIPCSTTPTFKFFQFGMESGSAVTQNWKIQQFDIWAQGSSLASNTAISTTGGNTCTTSSYAWVTCYTNATGTYGVQIGGDPYTNVNAKYKQNDATVPSGEIHWYKDGSSTTISNGLTLWP